MNVQKQEKGFTIIEVVLVLAIAALIFLMIFVALPALQRGQRDTARKNDQNTIVSAVNAWTGNHRGSLPKADDLDSLRTDYIKNLNQYDVDDVDLATDQSGINSVTTDTVKIVLEHKCDESGGEKLGSSQQRSAAVYVRLEASNAVVCADA